MSVRVETQVLYHCNQ